MPSSLPARRETVTHRHLIEAAGRIFLSKEVSVIVSVAQASMDDADSTRMFGIWSDIVVGDRPAGLVDCYLLAGDGAIHVYAIWESQAAHDHAVEETSSHPGFGFFEACGVDPRHAVYEVIGRMS